jgi:hypothetical protein
MGDTSYLKYLTFLVYIFEASKEKKELVSLLCEDNLRNIKMKKWRSTINIRIEHTHTHTHSLSLSLSELELHRKIKMGHGNLGKKSAKLLLPL